MTPGRRRLLVGLVSVVALALAATVLWSFGEQLALARRMRVDARQMAAEVAQELAISESLSLQLESIGTEAYVEEWARTEGGMARPGEVVVRVVPDSGSTPTPETPLVPEPKNTKQPFWIELWELLTKPE